jgi:hypothetical protein
MKIESYVDKYVSDGEQGWTITITAKEGDDVIFTFKPEYPGTAGEWSEMITACEIDDMNNYLSPDGSNCQISVNHKYVYFELSSYGNGMGGDIEIMIPKKLCVDAFKRIYETMIAG